MTTYAPLSDVLAGGEWVRRGMIWHWESTPEAEPEPELVEDRTRNYRPHDLIACPACLARMDEPCRGSRQSHTSRLVRRVCSCGEAVRPQEPMCGFCRAEMARGEVA